MLNQTFNEHKKKPSNTEQKTPQSKENGKLGYGTIECKLKCKIEFDTQVLILIIIIQIVHMIEL